MRQQVIQALGRTGLIAILRGLSVPEAVATARALAEGGVELVEVTFDQSSPEGLRTTLQSIRAIRQELGDRLLVGAGTVLNPEQVDMAQEAGALYIISPDTDPAVIRRTRELELVSIPGAFTPSEAKQAWAAGADFVKLFPCVGDGPAYLKAIRAPLSHIPFLAVGGVDSRNAAQFLRAGALGVGVGSSLTNQKWIAAGEYGKITLEARKLLEQLH